MHPRQLAIRLAQAHDRIKAATLTIGELSGVEAPDFRSIPAIGGPMVVRMKEAEMLAEYFEALLEQPTGTGKGRRARQRPAAVKTPPVEENGGAAQGDETQGEAGEEQQAPPTAETPTEPATGPDVAAVGAGDALPPPVVEPEQPNAGA